MMLAGLPVPADAVEDLADRVRDAGADDLADGSSVLSPTM